MKNLIETLVKALVDDAASVSIEEVADNRSVTYEITVNPDDLGKIIGKQGKVANALRTVTRSIGSKDNKSVYIKILP